MTLGKVVMGAGTIVALALAGIARAQTAPPEPTLGRGAVEPPPFDPTTPPAQTAPAAQAPAPAPVTPPAPPPPAPVTPVTPVAPAPAASVPPATPPSAPTPPPPVVVTPPPPVVLTPPPPVVVTPPAAEPAPPPPEPAPVLVPAPRTEGELQAAPVVVTPPPSSHHAPRGPGFALQGGGGVATFARPEMRSLADVGGAWTLRMIAGARRLFALEGAYVGSAHSLNGTAVGNNTALVGQGAEGTLRLNLRFGSPTVYVAPFGVGGFGWMHYRVFGDVDPARVSERDDIAVVPVGGGVAVGLGHMLLEGRVVYRFTFFDDLLAANRRDGDLRSTTAVATLGYMF